MSEALEPVKRRRGRPTKDPEMVGSQYNVYLPRDVHEWLKSQPEGVSGTIVRLVHSAMDRALTELQDGV